jgi:hypothetical protein
MIDVKSSTTFTRVNSKTIIKKMNGFKNTYKNKNRALGNCVMT